MTKPAANMTVHVDLSEMERLIREVPEQVSDFLDAEAEQMVNGIKLSFGSGPAGRAYWRGNVVHVASAPGYPPNVDTGTLRLSIDWETVDQFTRRIHDGVEYGVDLEFGKTNMAPRPFMGPEFERARRRLAADARAFGLVT